MPVAPSHWEPNDAQDRQGLSSKALRDGRVVYIGRERVQDVTNHPAFRNAVATFADFYDLKADPAHRAAADL